VLYNRESNPTGYGKEFAWWGGFHQLNYFPRKTVVVYARYDWIYGSSFDDTGAGGESKSHPMEWDLIGGLQFLIYEPPPARIRSEPERPELATLPIAEVADDSAARTPAASDPPARPPPRASPAMGFPTGRSSAPTVLNPES
jgi:hypothetical protein